MTYREAVEWNKDKFCVNCEKCKEEGCAIFVSLQALQAVQDGKVAELTADRDAAVALIERIEAEAKMAVEHNIRTCPDWIVALIKQWRNEMIFRNNCSLEKPRLAIREGGLLMDYTCPTCGEHGVKEPRCRMCNQRLAYDESQLTERMEDT